MCGRWTMRGLHFPDCQVCVALKWVHTPQPSHNIFAQIFQKHLLANELNIPMYGHIILWSNACYCGKHILQWYITLSHIGGVRLNRSNSQTSWKSHFNTQKQAKSKLLFTSIHSKLILLKLNPCLNSYKPIMEMNGNANLYNNSAWFTTQQQQVWQISHKCKYVWATIHSAQ